MLFIPSKKVARLLKRNLVACKEKKGACSVKNTYYDFMNFLKGLLLDYSISLFSLK
jgi:hypothetical protein